MTWEHWSDADEQTFASGKNGETYLIFMDFDPRSHDGLLKQAGVLAADKDIAFTWYDAARLTSFVKQNVVIRP